MVCRLAVLGSCGAWPEPGRACSGLLVEHGGFRIVIDLGYGTAARLPDQLGSVSADGLGGVIITHRHGEILLADGGLTVDLAPSGTVS